MGLMTPFLFDISAFDSSKSQIIKFEVKGGTQVSSNRLKIIDNKTGEIVYNELQSTYLPKHEIKANKLKNNQYYSAQIQTLDIMNNESQWSNMVQFYCYTTPTVEVTNIPYDKVVRGVSFAFEGTYNQIEGELLNAYKFDLYDMFNKQIGTSGLIGVKDKQILPFKFSYSFNGLENNKSYKLLVTCKTVNNTIIESNYVTFNVKYVNPNLYSLLYLSNNCKGGYIDVESNIINIEGTSNPIKPIYINKEKIDLRNLDSYVLWDKGYRINGDFNIRIWGSNFNDNTTIAIIDSIINKNTIKISFRRDKNDDMVYISMFVYNDKQEVSYYCCSNKVLYTKTDDELFICIKRIDNVYELKLVKEEHRTDINKGVL